MCRRSKLERRTFFSQLLRAFVRLLDVRRINSCPLTLWCRRHVDDVFFLSEVNGWKRSLSRREASPATLLAGCFTVVNPPCVALLRRTREYNSRFSLCSVPIRQTLEHDDFDRER